MMTDYERHQRRIMRLEGFQDNYVTPTGPGPISNPVDRLGWGNQQDTPIDWTQVRHEERMRIWAEEDAEMDDNGSVETFDSALEEESRVETFDQMLDRIDWVERNGVFRTLHPSDSSSYNLPGCNPTKVEDRVYLERMIDHEKRERKQGWSQKSIFYWKLTDLGRLRNRLESRNAVAHLKMLRENLRLVSAKKAIWNDFWNKLD